jgi:ribosomal protein S18 acetylase RimI-like enzyme
MDICRVESKRDLKAFIKFPYQFYARDKTWVAPLRSEQRKLFDLKANPYLAHCKWQLFLLKDQGKIVGRIAAFIDHIAIEAWKERVGLFAYYECIEDKAASDKLFEAAEIWLREEKCTSMRGPWSFVSQEWGMVVEGFLPSPVIMAPYNPPYYQELMEVFGLKKGKDLKCWEISMADGYRLPDRIMKATDVVAERYGVSVRRIDMKRYDEEIRTILELSNTGYLENWGYVPATEAEAEDMAKEMKRIIQPRGVLFAEDRNGRAIGYAIALPDLNVLLKGLNGRLFPFGFIKLLRKLPGLRRYRLFGLTVSPEYQKKAVDSLLFRALQDSLDSKDLWIEINYVLEDNWPMINAIVKLGAKESRRYRVYEMAISDSTANLQI